MTFDQFDTFQEDLLARVVEMKNTKGREYANSLDRFDNFKRLAERLGVSPLQVSLIYFTKHMDAIEFYIKHGKIVSTETIQGRFLDAITYLTLMAGMAFESDSIFISDVEAKPKYEMERHTFIARSQSSLAELKKCRFCKFPETDDIHVPLEKPHALSNLKKQLRQDNEL